MVYQPFALSDDDENDFNENKNEDCKINFFGSTLNYYEQKKVFFFLSRGDTDGLAKVNDLNTHVERNFLCKKRCQTLLTD